MCQRGGEVHQARVDWRLLVINIKSIIESISCLHSSKTYAPSLPKIFDSCTFAFFTIQATLHLVVYCKKKRNYKCATRESDCFCKHYKRWLKKESSLEPAQVKWKKKASTMNGTDALSACIQGRRRMAPDQHGFASLTTLFVRFMQIFVCLFVNLVVCPKQVRGENALWARESRSRFAICASTPTRKLSNGDRLKWFLSAFYFRTRKHSNHQHKHVENRIVKNKHKLLLLAMKTRLRSG